MEGLKSQSKEAMQRKTKAQVFLEEWKGRRKEDEAQFLKEINDPEHRKKMAAISGKIIEDGKAVRTPRETL